MYRPLWPRKKENEINATNKNENGIHGENENESHGTNENESESQITMLPESVPKNNTDDETAVLISNEDDLVDINNTEVPSSLNDQNSTDTVAVIFPGVNAETTESTSAESISSLAKTMIGVGIGCTALVALVALSKRMA